MKFFFRIVLLLLITQSAAFAQQNIDINDQYFDRFYRYVVTESTPSPGHFGMNHISSSNIYSYGLLAEVPVLGDDYVIAPSAGMLWYRYKVDGVEGDVPGLNQAVGLNFYLRPLGINIYTGYNFRYGKDVPYGGKYQEGTQVEDFEDVSELSRYLYLKFDFLDTFESLVNLNYAPGGEELAKTYIKALVKGAGFKFGLIYDKTVSEFENIGAEDFDEEDNQGLFVAEDGNFKIEYYEVASVFQYDFALYTGEKKRTASNRRREAVSRRKRKSSRRENSGRRSSGRRASAESDDTPEPNNPAPQPANEPSPFGGYAMLKIGKAFSVNEAEGQTYDSEFAKSENNFAVFEFSYWYVIGFSHSERNGFGSRFGVNYAIDSSRREVRQTNLSGSNEDFYKDKKFWVTLTYQDNYIMDSIFGTQVEPSSWLVSLTYR